MGSFLMIALFFTIRITPSASVTVTTMGKPSGMAATARLKEERRRQTCFMIYMLTEKTQTNPENICVSVCSVFTVSFPTSL